MSRNVHAASVESASRCNDSLVERKKASFGLGLSRLATELQLLTLLKRRKTYFHIDRDRGETGFLLFVDDVDEASFKS